MGLVGCSAGETGEDVVGQSGADLVSFGPGQCAAPAVQTGPLKDSSGQAIDGSAKTTLSGCILAASGETGTALLGRANALLTDTNSFGTLTDENGEKVFSSFRPQAPTGSLTSAGGMVQDIDVSLNFQFNPSTRLRVTRKVGADGSYNVTIVNLTALKATVAIFPVTAVNPGDLSASVTLSPESNGVDVKGAGQVLLQVEQDQASQTAQLVNELFAWLKTKLASG